MTDNNDNSASTSFFDKVRGQRDAPARSEYSPDLENDAFEEVEAIDALEDDFANSSELPHEARRVLVYLMRQGAVIGTQKPGVFATLCRYESQIRRHLAEVYLRLVLDEKAGVAFVGLNETETDEDDNPIDGESVSLISKRTLSLYDTLLLLVLRRHYQERESAGEQKIAVDLERLESYLTPFLPLTNHAKADRKKLNGAVQKLIQKKILAAARGAEDRYEITPIIRYVVDAAFLESMLDEYLRMAEEANVEIDVPRQPDPISDQPQSRQDDLLGGL
ncbi:DUF4194 domain-containing protein [Marinobacter koreensis]|uniref:DUF4194 domain-containing protein n=1 Tax=Marinobacter koreensis TaxID=335974 RepID=A0ABW0RNV5_9GAMM|nr:DUF4194 domain-containing protein [Marinobacter koreensis]MCK7549373.1 DUF4194 domain-containing protein [Marinobacter koreensis]